MAFAGTAAFGATATDQLLMSITSDAAAVRTDAHLGSFDKPAHVVASAAGLAFVVDRTADAYPWSDVRSISARRGVVFVTTEQLREKIVPTKNGRDVRRFMEKRTRRFRVLVDDVEEPALAATFGGVLEEVRTGGFSRHGTAWHEHLNAVERLQGDFSDQDDHVLPIAAAGLWLSIGVMSTFLVAVLVNTTAARSVPPGAFSLTHRVSAIDPRAIVAAFAFAGLVTTLVLRFALGPQALVWARGAARGWHRSRGRVRGIVVRTLGRLVLATSSSAAIVLLALLAFWPNIAATVLVDRQGIRNEVLLPFISIEQRWRDVAEISRVPAADPRERVGVRFRFADGRELSTQGLELGGGTELQLFELSTAWRAAAR